MRVWGTFHRHVVPSYANAYRPHLLNRSWLVAFLAVILATEGFLVASLVAHQSNDNFLAAVVSSDIVSLTNAERMHADVSPLSDSTLLDSAAQAKANDMAAKGYFSHVGPDGKEPWAWIAEAKYDYSYAGENLAVRFVDSSDVVRAWMASPEHRENILKPAYSNIGVGVATGLYEGKPATFVVQFFASPQKPDGAVLGTSTSTSSALASIQTTAASVSRLVAQSVVHATGSPRSTAFVILATIGTLLAVLILVAFFMHISIQSWEMLAGGAVVALLASGLVLLNAFILRDPTTVSTQAAAVSCGIDTSC